jgi:hypothetical protein
MATQINGSSQIQSATIVTDRLAAGILSADSTGRALFASNFFDSSTVSAKFASASIADDRLTVSYIKADGTRAFTGAQSMGGFKITSLGTPTTGTDAATKDYVDAATSSTILDVKQSVRAATTAALPAVTAAGSGAGKTLTADANGALTVDGVTIANSDRILVKNQSTASDNGIYTQTTLGTGGTAFVLTRATDADQNSEVSAGMFTFVSEGTANADTGWVLTTNDPITVDTSSQTFAQFTATSAFTGDLNATSLGHLTDSSGDLNILAGTASTSIVNKLQVGTSFLKVTDFSDATVFSVSNAGVVSVVDALTLETTSYAKFVGRASSPGNSATNNGHIYFDSTDDEFKVSENGGAFEPLVKQAGNGLSLNGSALDVNVDDSTIEINTDTLRLKDAGVTFAKLATAVSDRLGSYDRLQTFTGSTAATQDLAVTDADGSAATDTPGLLVYKNGVLLSIEEGDYDFSDNGGAGGVDRLTGLSRLSTDRLTVLYKRTGNAQ